MQFSSLQIVEPILRSLSEQGYTTPTPIQQQAIPIVLQGKDILGCAQTGTGKTAAFAIPIIQNLISNPKKGSKKINIRCLVLTPTRELAVQIKESFDVYGKYTSLKTVVIFGGVSQVTQLSNMHNGVDILVATPGRLLDLLNQKAFFISDIETLVLDEADRMLDMGFVNDVKKIITLVPQKRQTLFFSATMPKDILSLANSILHKPEKVEVTPVSSTAETISQKLYMVDKKNKNALLLHILRESKKKSVLVFTRTKHGADKVVKMLLQEKITSEAIHGNKSQNARQRALTNFKNGEIQVLVATDIAARGIDIDSLELVINFEIPEIAETFVHRIGRTGRAGASGTAISFCDIDEKADLQVIEKLIGFKLKVEEKNPFPMRNFTLTPKEVKKSNPRRGEPRNSSGGKPQGQNKSNSNNRKPEIGKRRK